jgi:hypothetical protein
MNKYMYISTSSGLKGVLKIFVIGNYVVVVVCSLFNDAFSVSHNYVCEQINVFKFKNTIYT